MKKVKKINKLAEFDEKINSFIDSLIPAIMFMIPIIFSLYVLNLHGYLSSTGEVIFKLNHLYQFLFYILAGIYLYKVFSKKNIITKTDVFLFIFMFFTVLSTILAYDKNIALYGYPNRYEGMYTLLFYGFLYLDCKLLSHEVKIKNLLKMMLLVSTLHLIMVILQLTGLYEKLIFMYTSHDAIGLTENCNFLGSLMCLFSMLSVSGFLVYKKGEASIYFLIMFVISCSTLLLANSSGPFLSFIATFILSIIVLLFKKMFAWRKFALVFFLIVFLYPVCLFKRDEITPEIKSNFNTIVNLVLPKDKTSLNDLEQEKAIKNLGHGRIRIWSNVWQLIKEKPLIGYGPDNLGLVYEKGSDEEKIADKAHNIYLHIFASSGIFAVISYILWIVGTIYLGIKSKDRLVLILVFGSIAYAVQGIFNINVIEVTPYFYLTVGLMMALVNEKKLNLL